MLKQLIRSLIRPLGFDIHRIHTPAPRASLVGSLEQLKKLGVTPATVIDVGAAQGEFTTTCRNFFPEAAYVLIEPLMENQERLRALTATIPRSHLHFAAAGAVTGETVINVHEDLVGSSLLSEHESREVNGRPRTVPIVTVDAIVREANLRGPFLIKVDVQGFELQVLDGAQHTLAQAEYVLLEASLFRFFVNGPLFHEVVAYMQQRGFVLYDVVDTSYRLLDNALSQMDVAFVRDSGPLWREHVYASPLQRQEHNRRKTVDVQQLLDRRERS